MEASLSLNVSRFEFTASKDECLQRLFLYKLFIYRVSQEECARLREGVPYVKIYRYNPKHLCPMLNGYGDNGARKVWPSCGSTYCTWFA